MSWPAEECDAPDAPRYPGVLPDGTPDDCELEATGMATAKPEPGRRTLIPPVHPDLNQLVAPHLPRAGFRSANEVV